MEYIYREKIRCWSCSFLFIFILIFVYMFMVCLFSIHLCVCLWFVYFQFIYVHIYGLFIFNSFMYIVMVCLFSIHLCVCLWFVYFQFIYVHSYGLFIFNSFMCMFVVLYVLKCAHVSLFTTCCIILNVFQVYINIVILVYPLYYHFLGVSVLLFNVVSLNVNAAFIFESLTFNYQQHYLKESYQRYVGSLY